ncbi:hypothetical protein O9993_03320 [Vibrio lentus]|nr:hypothetical protein [Vibrio lentus]
MIAIAWPVRLGNCGHGRVYALLRLMLVDQECGWLAFVIARYRAVVGSSFVFLESGLDWIRCMSPRLVPFRCNRV